jgi:hypothetical protein
VSTWLSTWRDNVREVREVREREETAEAHHAVAVAARAFRGFEDAARRGRRRRIAARGWQDTHARRALRRWRARTVAKLRAEVEARIATRHAYGKRSRGAWGTWKAFLWDRREKRLRADIALDHFSLCRRTVAFAAWRGAYMDDVRMFRERATVYRKTVESRALRVALYEWSDAAYARAVFREMEIRADAHRGAVLLARALDAWRLFIRGKRENRTRVARRVAVVASALATLKRDRAWCAWAEWTRSAAVKTIRKARAAEHFRMATTLRALAAWWDRVLRRRDKDDAMVVANDARDRRYAYGALEGWVRYVVTRRRKTRNMGAATRHRSKVLATNAVAGWREWKRAREAKRLRFSDALSMHSADLLREGAAAWLTEGLRRQEARREAATAAAAEREAAALRRVRFPRTDWSPYDRVGVIVNAVS